MLQINGQDATLYEVHEYLEKNGYQVKPGKGNLGKKVLNARKNHCRIVITQWNYSQYTQHSCKLLTRTIKGGWQSRKWHNDIGLLVGWAENEPVVTVKRTVPIRKSNLPDPDEFSPEWTEYDGNKWVNYTGRIQKAAVNGVVAIEEDGTVTEQAIYDDKNRSWFSVTLIGATHATTIIITDGEEWYLVGMNSKKTNLRLKRNDGITLNTVDQAIIQDAIAEFVQGGKVLDL